MKNAIITFVRKTELGKVKTRLAADIGEAAALKIYEQLLQHTHAVIDEVTADKFIFYTDIVADDLWNGYHKFKQTTGNLGTKISAAFDTVFNLGYQKIIIIGSDCFDLKAQHIDTAFNLLKKNEVVIGPTFDGGYYLLGLKKPMPHLFEGINWSTATVFDETVSLIVKSKYITLTYLNDIDTVDDLKKYNSFNYLT